MTTVMSMLVKKWFAILLASLIVLLLSACASKKDSSEDIPSLIDEEGVASEEIIEDNPDEELIEYYVGKWIARDNPDCFLIINDDGTGNMFQGSNQLFNYSFTDSGLETDLENGLELISYESHGMRYLSNLNYGEFYYEDDISNRDKSEEIVITHENWEDYFEIHRDTFGESSYETGKLCYLCEIIYVSVKDEYSGRIDEFRDFSVSFDFSFHRAEYYANVDDVAHTFEEATMRNDYGKGTGVCTFDNASFARIKNLDYVWSDGFAHTSLRDDYIYEYWYKFHRDTWLYVNVHDINLTDASGSIYLFG